MKGRRERREAARCENEDDIEHSERSEDHVLRSQRTSYRYRTMTIDARSFTGRSWLGTGAASSRSSAHCACPSADNPPSRSSFSAALSSSTCDDASSVRRKWRVACVRALSARSCVSSPTPRSPPRSPPCSSSALARQAQAQARPACLSLSLWRRRWRRQRQRQRQDVPVRARVCPRCLRAARLGALDALECTLCVVDSVCKSASRKV